MEKLKNVLLFFVLLGTFFLLPAQEKRPGVDIFLLFDKSKSLNDYGQISEMKNWVEKNIVDGILIPGDWICIKTFCGENETLLEMEIADTASIEKIRETVKNIKADGYYTDLGLLMDNILPEINARQSRSNRKHFVFVVSDMIQQAAPESPYNGKDKFFSHSALKYTRETKHKYWKDVAVGINIDSKINSIATLFYNGMNSGKPRLKGSVPVPRPLAQNPLP